MDKRKERRNLIIILCACIAAALLWIMYDTGIIVRFPDVLGDTQNAAVHAAVPEYVQDAMEKFDPVDPALEIGMNCEDAPVFKHPHAALRYLKEHYTEELKQMHKAHLQSCSGGGEKIGFFVDYLDFAEYYLGDLYNLDGDEERIAFIGEFLFVYQNSYFSQSGFHNALLDLLIPEKPEWV